MVEISLYFYEVLFMTMLEDDLLAALRELLETSEIMTCGVKFSAEEMIRYRQSVEWAKRVIELAES
jgi:hypothetical protein